MVARRPWELRRFVQWPRVESNHRAQIRSLPLYPLSYGAGRAKVSMPEASPGPHVAEAYLGTRTTSYRAVAGPACRSGR